MYRNELLFAGFGQTVWGTPQNKSPYISSLNPSKFDSKIVRGGLADRIVKNPSWEGFRAESFPTGSGIQPHKEFFWDSADQDSAERDSVAPGFRPADSAERDSAVAGFRNSKNGNFSTLVDCVPKRATFRWFWPNRMGDPTRWPS